MKKLFSVLLLLILTALPLFYNSCGRVPEFGKSQGTETNNPRMTFEFGEYSLVANPSPIQSLMVCAERVRLREAGTQTYSDYLLPAATGGITLLPAGTGLGGVNVSPGQYDQVLVELNSACAGQSSIQVSNNNGVFETAETVVLVFDGSITVDALDVKVTLGIQLLVDSLSLVNADNEIRTNAEAVVGPVVTRDNTNVGP
jgi:hypothetical protein